MQIRHRRPRTDDKPHSRQPGCVLEPQKFELLWRSPSRCGAGACFGRNGIASVLGASAKACEADPLAIFGRRAIPNLHPLDLDGTDTGLEASLGRSKSRLSHLIITRLACVTLTAVNWLPGSPPIAAQKRPSPNHRPPPSVPPRFSSLGYHHQQKPCGAWFIGNIPMRRAGLLSATMSPLDESQLTFRALADGRFAELRR